MHCAFSGVLSGWLGVSRGRGIPDRQAGRICRESPLIRRRDMVESKRSGKGRQKKGRRSWRSRDRTIFICAT